MRCSHCGNEIQETSKFCGFCGAQVTPQSLNAEDNQNHIEDQDRAEQTAQNEVDSGSYDAKVNIFSENEAENEDTTQLEDKKPEQEMLRHQETQVPKHQTQQSNPYANTYVANPYQNQNINPYQDQNAKPYPNMPPYQSTGGGVTTQKKKSKLPLILAGVLLLITLAILGPYLILKPTTINLNKYASVTFTGYDGTGVPELIFDEETFRADNEKVIKKSLSNYYGTTNPVSNLIEDILYWGEFIPNVYLSNGHSVTYDWNVDYVLPSNSKIVLQSKDLTATVVGLQEPKIRDPFEDLEMEYSGYSGQGYVNFFNNADNYLYFYSDDEALMDGSLSNGDQILVKIGGYDGENDQEFFVQEYGFIPEPLEKRITLDGFGNILTDSSQITDDILSQLQVYSIDLFENDRANYWDKEIKDAVIDYLGNYLLVNKYEKNDSRLILVYQVTATIEDEIDSEMVTKEFTYFWPMIFDVVPITKDGELAVESPYDLYYYSTYNSAVFEFDSDSWINYYFTGYESLDDLYQDLIQKESFDYLVQENVK